MGFPRPAVTPVQVRISRTENFGRKWNPGEEKKLRTWNLGNGKPPYIPEITTSHDDIDYNETVDKKGRHILQRWRSYEMEETEVTLCKTNATTQYGIRTVVSRDHYRISLHALRSLPMSMFG